MSLRQLLDRWLETDRATSVPRVASESRVTVYAPTTTSVHDGRLKPLTVWICQWRGRGLSMGAIAPRGNRELALGEAHWTDARNHGMSTMCLLSIHNRDPHGRLFPNTCLRNRPLCSGASPRSKRAADGGEGGAMGPGGGGGRRDGGREQEEERRREIRKYENVSPRSLRQTSETAGALLSGYASRLLAFRLVGRRVSVAVLLRAQRSCDITPSPINAGTLGTFVRSRASVLSGSSGVTEERIARSRVRSRARARSSKPHTRMSRT